MTEEVVTFLYKTYEESAIPPILVHTLLSTLEIQHCVLPMCMGQFYIDELRQPEPFISTLNIASCLFEVCTKHQAQAMAERLGELHSICDA